MVRKVTFTLDDHFFSTIMGPSFPNHLVTIAADGSRNPQTPTVPFEQYSALENRMPGRFTGFAYYRPVRAQVQSAQLSTAVASANLKARNTNTEESAKASLTKTNVAPQIRVQRISRRSALSFRDTRAGVGSTGGRIQPRYLQQDQQHALHSNLAARRVVRQR